MSVTPQTQQSTPQMQSTPLQQSQSTSAASASTATTTASDIQVLGSTESDKPTTDQFQFAPPKKIDWHNLPEKGGDDNNDDDDDDFPDVSL